jgi:hypothetical protein
MTTAASSSKGPSRTGWTLHLPQRKGGERQHDQVGHDVAGVAEQGEAVRPESTDHLDDQDDRGQQEGQPHSGGRAGAHIGEPHGPYLIAHLKTTR